jgi:L-2-amino-thiazoline-4-carboxylic acid hydrolase
MTDDGPVGHLQRRKIEGRVLVPFVAVCRDRLGERATRELVAAFIRKVSVDDGVKSAERFGGDMAGLRRIAEEVWGGPGGGIDVQMLAQSDDRLDFNVTRCGYAALYKEWGLTELGFELQCSRDHAMLQGFNDGITLERTQTIMQGAAHCDFRFRKKAPSAC